MKGLRFPIELMSHIYHGGPFSPVGWLRGEGIPEKISQASTTGHYGPTDNTSPFSHMQLRPKIVMSVHSFPPSNCRCGPSPGAFHPQFHHHQPALHPRHEAPRICEVQLHREGFESPGKSPLVLALACLALVPPSLCSLPAFPSSPAWPFVQEHQHRPTVLWLQTGPAQVRLSFPTCMKGKLTWQ